MHSGPAKGEIEWRRPNRETLQIMLHNPVYAGYYAYGRRQVEPRKKMPGRPSTGRVVRDSGEWLVLLPGRLPAYITPEQCEANVARMAANRQTAATPGAPRDGSALLSGLLRCGRCGGHRMVVRYHDGSHAGRSAHGYVCAFCQGLVSNLSNPKMAVFFIGLLPQFTGMNRTPLAAMLALALVFSVMTFAWLACCAAAAAKASGCLRTQWAIRMLDALSGTVLAGLGIRLGTEHL